MGVSRRKGLAIGLGLAGVIYLGAQTQGQQTPKGDQRVQPANGTTASVAPGGFAPATPTIVGTIDLDQVFKSYDKVKVAIKEIRSAMQVRKGELMKLDDQGRQEIEMMQKFQPGSPDYRKHEDRATELKAKIEALKEQAEREITLRNAETMATLYREVQLYAGWVARKRGITHVITVSNAPPAGSDPNTVLAAINRPLVFADPRNDITNDVIYHLNNVYNGAASGNKAATKAAGTRQPQAAGAGAGAGAGGAGAPATRQPGEPQ